MESYIQLLYILSSFLLFLLFLIKTDQKTKHLKLPPSPWKLPVIGNIHQLLFSSSLPHHTLRNLAKKHGPLMHLKLGEVPAIVITSPEIAKEVLKDHDINFSNRPYLLAAKILSYDSTNIVSAPYGSHLKQLRKIYMIELLSPGRVKSFRYIREDEVSNLVKTISSREGSIINLSKMIYSFTYGVTSRVTFGNKWKDRERFNSIVARGTKLTAGYSVSDMFPSSKLLEMMSGLRPKAEKLRQEINNILENIIEQHREREEERKRNGEEEKNEDLVDFLLELQERDDLESPVTDDRIKGVLVGVIAAGSETTSTIVEWAMAEMLKNPSLMKKAQHEARQVFDENGNADETGLHKLKLLKAIIKETMRLHPTGPLLLPRECVDDCVISGYDIPAKTKVVVNAWAIGRDPKYWDDAEKFFPERFLDSPIEYKGTHFQFLPFGSGRRICPGIVYAISNIELPLAKLLYHFDWKLANEMRPEDLDMNEAFGTTVRRKENLFVVPTSYRPLGAPKVTNDTSE